MSYVEAETSGPTVLFLHGNPTSSHIWRNIIPHVAPLGRCIAPDLIGYGQSGKPDIDYRFFDHVRYLDAFLDALDIRDVVLVAQDLGHGAGVPSGSAPAAAHPRSCFHGVYPALRALREDFHQRPQAREMFKALRTPGVGEKLALEDNVFVEKVLPASVLRTMGDEEMAVYRAPFPTPQSRKPVLRLPRELPIEGQPADVAAISEHDHRALRLSIYPKLLFAGDPGALIRPEAAREFAAGLKNCRFINLEDPERIICRKTMPTR